MSSENPQGIVVTDGSTQVTKRAIRFTGIKRTEKDSDAGDAQEERIKSSGAEWCALGPSGKKVDLS
ncbi:MAG TPA: hypothetical protein VGL78_10215 [Solirubrobacteraceae bacterium]